jgi:hypothetical protein
MKLTGENRSTRVKTCPSATLSTTNLTWTEPGSNPGLRGERPATSRLSHGTSRMFIHPPIQRLPEDFPQQTKRMDCSRSCSTKTKNVCNVASTQPYVT